MSKKYFKGFWEYKIKVDNYKNCFFLVLFHGAIQQSGSEFFNSRSSNARQIAFDAGKKIDKNFNSNDSKELLKVLLKASAEDILHVSLT